MRPPPIALFSRCPPPVGGVSVWTAAFLAAAPAAGLTVRLHALGPAPTGPLLARRPPALRRGLAAPLGRLWRLPAGTGVHVCASGGASFWRALIIAAAARAQGRVAVVHLHSRLYRCGPAARRVAAALVRTQGLAVVTPHRGDAAHCPWLRHVPHFVQVPGGASGRAGPEARGRAATRAQGRHQPAADAATLAPLRLLYAGWMVREKGIMKLLAALARAPEVALEAVGPDVRPADLRAFCRGVRTRGLAGRVRYGGELPGPALARAMRAADAVICPSADESFGLVAAEALAAGVPLVARPVGVLAEAPPGTFVPLPPGGASAWAVALAELAADRAPLAAAGPRGAAWAAQHLAPATALAAWAALYHELAEAVSPGARAGAGDARGEGRVAGVGAGAAGRRTSCDASASPAVADRAARAGRVAS